jgi:hypothetical protein
MKKWAQLTATGVLAMGLAACGQTAEPTSETTEEQTSDKTLEEVFDKSMEISNATEILSAKVDMTQKMEQSSQDLAMETASVMDMDITMDPLAIYQKGTTTMKTAGSEEELAMNSIEKVDYTINIDKETFETTTVDMTMEMEGETMQINQVMNADYSNYNGVETITVPEDIVNSAQEMQM